MMASIRDKTTILYSQIYEYQIKLVLHYSHSTATRYAKDLASSMRETTWKSMADEMKATHQQIEDSFESLNLVQTSSVLQDLSDLREQFEQMLATQRETRWTQIRAGMKYSERALHDHSENEKRPKCLEGTQVLPLQEVRDWCEADDDKMILWLHGMTGTGKSTIARTVAAAVKARKWTDGTAVREGTELAGTFFFWHGSDETNRAKFLIPTLAWCLVRAIPALKPYILEAVNDNPDITSKTRAVQWERLVFEPLSILNRSSPVTKHYLIVIDSLDECQDRQEVQRILELFAQLHGLPSAKIKILISRRSERHIRKAFSGLSFDYYKERILEKIPRARDDRNKMMHFLKTELGKIASAVGLPHD
jgi:hypothetical protein